MNQDHYEEVIRRLDVLAKLHGELADLLDTAPNLTHAGSDHSLAKAERTSAATCVRVAATIRTRLFEGDKP